MSDRVTRILLTYFEQIDALPSRPDTFLAAARDAFAALLGAEEVLFYRKQGTVFHLMRFLPPGAADQYIPIRGQPQEETIRMEAMACMAQSAGRPVCVSPDGPEKGGRWAIPFGSCPPWGFAFCDVRRKPGADALAGAMRVAQSLHRRQKVFLPGEDILEQKQDTAAVVSHEFKTPLTITVTAAEVLQKKLKKDAVYPAGDNVYKYMDVLLLNIYKAQRLSANMADCIGMDFYPHIQEGADAAACLREIEKQVLSYTEERGVSFVVEQPGQSPVLCACDLFLLERIVLNLITNAIQHTPAEGRVTVRLQNTAAFAQIAVENDGPDIPEESMPHLFEKFWRGGEIQGGTGLGLYISQKFAEKMGGRIQAENRPEGGPRFTLSLPAKGGASGVLGSAQVMYRPHTGELVRVELSVLRDVK